MDAFVRRVTGIEVSDRRRCPPVTPANYRLITTSASGCFESYELVPELGKCGKTMVQLVVRPRRRPAKGVVFVIGIGTGEARGCNAAHIAKGMKPGAETLSGIARCRRRGRARMVLIDFAWT